jgi:sulfotransferase family protein
MVAPLPPSALPDLASGQHRLVLIGGLHRSGTTPLARALSAHPDISGLGGTGVREDEGQHLQNVYPKAKVFGGAGRFALAEEAHLTEASPLVTYANREQLLRCWTPYWDLTRPILVEKSPPNLIMTRFLQALFPEAYQLIVVRHPVVVSLSTKKWARVKSLSGLMEHWFRAYDLFMSDASLVSRLMVVRYEDLVTRPAETLGRVGDFLGVATPIPTDTIRGDRSDRYEQMWNEMVTGSFTARAQRRRIERNYAERAARYGYRLDDLNRVDPVTLHAA